MPVKSGLILVVVGSGVQHPYIIIYIYYTSTLQQVLPGDNRGPETTC